MSEFSILDPEAVPSVVPSHSSKHTHTHTHTHTYILTYLSFREEVGEVLHRIAAKAGNVLVVP